MREAPVLETHDEVLERLWLRDERRESGHDAHDCPQEEFSPPVYAAMVDAGLLTPHHAEYAFTETGRLRAGQVIRNQRLSERLLTDVLRVSESAVASQACKFEHCLHEEVVESICTLLGHPRFCPHGYAIPPGPCCARAAREVPSLVCRLTGLRPGETGTVVYIETHAHQRLDRLMAFGLLPGRQVRVHQVRPTLVVYIGETQLALEAEIAACVHVRRSALAAK